jgi:hypothetical protein
MRAIRSGQVDAIIIPEAEGDRLYGLQPLDIPYKELFEALVDAALVLDPQGRVTFCSPSCTGVLGLPQERIERQELRGFVVSDDRARFEDLLKAGGSSHEDALLRLCGGGEEAVVRLGVSPLPNDFFPEESGEGASECGGFVAVMTTAAMGTRPAGSPRALAGRALDLASGMVSALHDKQSRLAEQIQDGILPTLARSQVDLEWIEEKLRWTEGRPHSSVFARLRAVRERLGALAQRVQK